MELFGLFGSKDSRAERRAARRAAAASRDEKRKASRAAAASRAQVDAFLRYLATQTSGSYYGASAAQLEDHQDDARYIVSFYREHLAKHGQEARAASLPELLALVSPDHEGYGLSRYRVQYWISDYESTQRSAGQRKRG